MLWLAQVDEGRGPEEVLAIDFFPDEEEDRANRPQGITMPQGQGQGRVEAW